MELQFSNDAYYTFIASSAEIFGALIGLLCVAYIYRAESVRENVARIFSSLQDNIKKTKCTELEYRLKNQIDMDIQSLKNVISEIQADDKADIDSNFYSSLANDIQNLEDFSNEIKVFRTRFIYANTSAFVILFIALCLLAAPQSFQENYNHFAIPGLFFLDLIAGFYCLRFVTSFTKEKHVYSLNG